MFEFTAKKSTLLALTILITLFIVLTGCQTIAMVDDDEPSTTADDELQTEPTSIPDLASAPEDIIGTWSVAVGRTWTFHEDGTYFFEGPDWEHHGIYSFSGTELSIKLTPDGICGNVTGKYEVQILDNALIFVSVDDECGARRLDLEHSGQQWERVP